MRFLLPLILCAAGLPAPKAEAAASPNPFAGSYQGFMPGGSVLCNITVSADGKISGSGSWGSPIFGLYVRVSGSVSGSGRMACTVTTTVPKRGSRGGVSSSSKFRATVSLNAAGDIVGTTQSGYALAWYRV
jgi:hypothetical protein